MGLNDPVQETQSWSAKAFAPAHLTGFFEIHDEHKNPYRKGSRGAGLNLDMGVTADVTIHQDEGAIEVYVNGIADEAPTVHRAVRGLLGDAYPARVEIRLSSDLPPSQGFGLSGAGALATGFALAELVKFPVKNAVWEAHKAEVESRTGLGDVPAQFVGGAEVRVTPGPMPMGVTERFAGIETRRWKIVCCVLDEPLTTSSVLGDPARRQRVNDAAVGLVEALKDDPTLSTYMRLSRRFAEAAGFITPPLADALDTADRHGLATQTMLGNALHCLVAPEAADAAAEGLQGHGRVWVCGIATRGAHVVRE
ncbi:MAG: hypothetical protein KY455_01140 [Euryarchaeota archaeon]|nr:hypothetical protein [Euryarchaeota archaeon]